MTLYTVIIKTIKGSLLTIFHFLFHIYRIYKANSLSSAKCERDSRIFRFPNFGMIERDLRSKQSDVNPYILMEKETLRELQFDMGVLHS
jgi:hypothetical protein